MQRAIPLKDPPTAVVVQEISSGYDRVFSRFQRPRILAKLSTLDVNDLFLAAQTAQFYTLKSTYVDDMLLDFKELGRRSVASKLDRQSVVTALVATRRFREAKAYAGTSIADVPRYVDHSSGNRVSILWVEDQGAEVVRRDAMNLHGTYIVIMSSPLCHFNQAAVRSFDKRKGPLRALFQHAIWLVPPDESTTFSEVAEWNAQHPQEPMQFAYRRTDWPMIDRWEMPTFYFVRDGKLVDEVIGWPHGGNVAAIETGLKKLGYTDR
jgi:hypothetical protein